MEELERPDLTNLPPEVVTYIESLENQLAAMTAGQYEEQAEATAEWNEPAGPYNLITVSAHGLIKRTPRHLYTRQRRGGMGVFDLDVAADDMPTILTIVDENLTVLVFTNKGRAFRLPVADIPQTGVHGRGRPLEGLLPLHDDEYAVAVLPGEGDPGRQDQDVVLASDQGWVRRVRASFFGSVMPQGAAFHNPHDGGQLAAACWAAPDEDLFVVSGLAQAIRFPGHAVRDRAGCQGLRLEEDDGVLAVCPVTELSGVFLLGEDGRGTIRLMSGFRANRAPGAGGKQALKTTRLAGAVTVGLTDDLFVISHLGKIIRFAASDVPPKEGLVQGVSCISLRADQAATATASPVTSA
jgi:DNA gyrase subunit A